MNSIRGTSLNIKENNNGNLTFSSDTQYKCVSSSYDIRTNSTYTLNATNAIKLNSDSGNINVNVNNGELKLTSLGNLSNAVILEATHPNGGILQTSGTSGITLNTNDGDINLLSKGSNINIGVSPVGTSSTIQTQNLNMECFNNYNLNSGDMYFVSSDVISFISQSGDIQFGTSSGGVPIIQFLNQNLLVNQSSSVLDYQLDVAITDESSNNTGYNGIIVNTKLSNVAADLTLQTSNTLGDGTQCILSMGSFGSNNTKAIFDTYIAYQTNNVVIRTDGDTYNPMSLNVNNGKDFTFSDIGKEIYWETTKRLDTIIGLSSTITTITDTSNVTISGSYTGETSRVYLLQIDSLGTPNTFKWSNDGGNNYIKQLIPITLNAIPIENGMLATFTYTTGFIYNQQFIFQTKITALVSNTTSITTPEPLNILQPFHAYINTITPSDIVINTNNKEKMRITGDGSISINQNLPKATLDINSNYNKIIHVNETVTGYQINPAIGYLESGGYVSVWNSQHSIEGSYHYDVVAQRYMADGSKYNNNFTVNTEANNTTQTTPSITGHKVHHSNHYLISWKSYNSTSNNYYIYSKIYHNNNSITSYSIENRISSHIINNVRCAGLYNGNYIIVWAENNGSGKYSIYGQIINDTDGSISASFQISPITTYSRNFPFVAGLPGDDTYTPNGFVVGYMSALDSTSDPVYTISARVFNSSGTATTNEIAITTTNLTNVSDGLVSVSEIKNHNVNGINGGFLISFYRSYQANTNLYAISNPITGLTSGTTSSILNLNFAEKQIILDDDNSIFLIGEEIRIISSVGGVGEVIEKINSISYVSSNIIITLDTGSRSIDTYCYASNATLLWANTNVNTSPLYNDLERYTSNTSSNVSIFQYKKPLSYITTDNQGTALVSWTSDSIPNIYYQLLNISDGSFIGTEKKLTNEYNGLKQRNQVTTHLQSTQGSDYGFVISWDNQSLDLQDTGIYQQLIGYKHNLLNLEDGNSNFIFTHYNQLGIGTTTPESSLHIKTRLSNVSNSNNTIADPPNKATLKLQNTSTHVITNEDLQSIEFSDGSNSILTKIQSINSLRYDDLYPQPTNLKGFYKFDSSYGSQCVDSSIYNHTRNNTKQNTNGILNNFNFETCWNDGLINNTLLFDGNNNYIFINEDANNELNTILENIKNMSISLWIKIPSDIVDGSTYDIISNGGNVSVAGTYIMGISDVGSNGSMVFTSTIITHEPTNVGVINTIGLQGSLKLNDNTWHHIVETVTIVDSDTINSNCSISMYVDGVLTNSITSAGDITIIDQHSNDKVYIGSRDGTVNYYRGTIDELRIYNSILTTDEIIKLYAYGNPNVSAKGTLLITPNLNSTNNKVIVIDDNGRFNNLNSRPLPYKLLTGDVIATENSKIITGTNTFFTSELNIGDSIILGENYDVERVVMSIINNTTLILDSRGFAGPEETETYKKVFKKPCIYSFFDNSDSHRGHIDNYGRLMIGNTNPSTLLEISGVDGSIKQTPEITMTNTSLNNGSNTRKTSLNFRGYDTSDTSNANPFVNLGHIETSHYGTSADNKATMRFFINTGSGTTENSAMDITSDGITIYESISLPITTRTTALTLDNTHHTIICNITLSSFAITLPASSSSGRIYILKKYATSGSFALTINPNGNQIDGSGSTYTVSTSFIKLQSDGTNWWVIG